MEDKLGSVNKSQNYIPTSSIPIKKNFYILCFAFFLYSGAITGVHTVQSSVNFHHGLGVTITSIYYGVGVLANMFWAAILTRWLGLKKTIMLAIAVQIAYFMSNVYPTWYTMTPTAILSGVVASGIRPAKNAYISRLGDMTDTKTTSGARLFGIHFVLTYISNIFATSFSYVVLKAQEADTPIQFFCGSSFCDYLVSANDTNFAPISTLERVALYGGFSAMAIVAIILFCFLDEIGLGAPLTLREYASLALSTIRQFQNKNQVLLSVANFYRGISYGFITADFTKAFVTCSFGVRNVGFVIMAFAAGCAAFSLIFSHLAKYLGRIPIFSFFVSIHAFMIISMLTWFARPEENALYTYLIIAGAWGIGYSVLEYQIGGLYSYLFPISTERAFNAHQLLEDLGLSFSFATSSVLCVTTKLYILSGILALTAVGYFMIEIPILCRQKKDVALQKQLIEK